MSKKIYLFFFISLITSTAALAQQSLDVNFNGLGFLDNREYKAFVPRSRTYSGTRTDIDLGLNLDSMNHFIVGANLLHEFGALPFFGQVDPVAYYKFTGKSWDFFAGEFPRAGLLDNYPRALLNDTLQYYRPNVEGLLARFHTDNFTETGWIDWLSRQTDTRREQFLFGFEGNYRPVLEGPFYVSHFFYMMHDAGAAITVPGDHINDNGAGEVLLGLDFSHKTVFDSLSFEAGSLMSFQRARGIDGFQTPAGVVFNAYASYHRFAIFEEFYHGKGSEITYGDSYYSKPTYNRIDIIFTAFKAARIKGQFTASFHFTPGQFNDNQESFKVTYDLGRKILTRFSPDKDN